MRNAETILNIIRQRGQRGLPVTDAYRLLYQRDLYLRAYGKLYRNHGAMTPGSTGETVDGMSLEKIDTIINALRDERYRWTPVRRTYVPKKNGKRRPLGLPMAARGGSLWTWGMKGAPLGTAPMHPSSLDPGVCG
jgi:hypothetical protein